jgi:hypothetical protein
LAVQPMHAVVTQAFSKRIRLIEPTCHECPEGAKESTGGNRARYGGSGILE